MVHAIDHVRNAFPRSGKHHFANAFTLEVKAKRILIAPNARVVDHQRIVDTISRVVNGVWIVGSDHCHRVAVDDERLVLHIHNNGSRKWAMHRIGAQKVCPLLKVVFRI